MIKTDWNPHLRSFDQWPAYSNQSSKICSSCATMKNGCAAAAAANGSDHMHDDGSELGISCWWNRLLMLLHKCHIEDNDAKDEPVMLRKWSIIVAHHDGNLARPLQHIFLRIKNAVASSRHEFLLVCKRNETI